MKAFKSLYCILAPVLLTWQALGDILPTVRAIKPVNGSAINSSTFPDVTITGACTAKRGVGVQMINFLYLGFNYQNQVTINPDGVTWSLDVGAIPVAFSTNLPVPGTNTFFFWAVDNSNVLSGAVKYSFFYEVPTPLTLQTNGSGTITGEKNGANLFWGRSYSVNALPKTGWLFYNWTDGSTNVLGTNTTLDFMMQPGTTLQANFVTNAFIHATGQYTGLFLDTNAVDPNYSGYITVTTEPTGAFSGKLLNKGKSYPFSGIFADQTNHTGLASISSISNSDVSLYL